MKRRFRITAHAVNQWRVWPRAIISLYGYIFYRVIEWYMSLPAPSIEQTGFVSTVVGAAAAFFGFYVNSGPGRTQQPQDFSNYGPPPMTYNQPMGYNAPPSYPQPSYPVGASSYGSNSRTTNPLDEK